MKILLAALRAPGSRRVIECAAPTQRHTNITHEEKNGLTTESQDVNEYIVTRKVKRLDRWLDRVVEASGSEYVYFGILTALLVWIFLAIPFGSDQTWQIVISDAQAIINMVFDAFLMRQQLNSHDSMIYVSACLRSRSRTHNVMLRQLIASGHLKKTDARHFQQLEHSDHSVLLPKENWLTKISTAVSTVLGHIVTIALFWVCIFVWLGFGHYMEWSDVWQLDINSATSALMVFSLAFIANVRERHAKHTTACLRSIWEVDVALERRLRLESGYTVENEIIVIPPEKRSKLQRAIDYYADLVGTLTGIAILILVLILWVALGPAFRFGDNWWLLIGTYAGLIGLNDGFVLRNVSTVLGYHEESQFRQVDYEDLNLLDIVGAADSDTAASANQSLTSRISIWVGDVCSHEYMVLAGCVFTVGLVIGASAMGWNETGQLLCNVPPSIVESFFTLMLITGHNVSEANRRGDLANFHARRVRMLAYVESSEKNSQDLAQARRSSVQA